MNVSNATVLSTTAAPAYSSGSFLSVSAKQAIYWSVASIALTSNLFFCTALLTKGRRSFRKPYTVIVFTLGITDIMTAVFLFISPRYAMKDTFPQPSTVLGLRFFCNLIWGRLPLYYFGVVSMYLTILLTVDRWFAVVRPTQYQTTFNKKRALIGVALSAILALIVMAGSTSTKTYHPERPNGQRCGMLRQQPTRFRVTVTVAFFFKTAIPLVAITGMYLHMFYKLKTISEVTQQHSAAVKKRITKAAAVATLLFLFCFCPNMVCVNVISSLTITTTVVLTTTNSSGDITTTSSTASTVSSPSPPSS